MNLGFIDLASNWTSNYYKIMEYGHHQQRGWNQTIDVAAAESVYWELPPPLIVLFERRDEWVVCFVGAAQVLSKTSCNWRAKCISICLFHKDRVAIIIPPSATDTLFGRGVVWINTSVDSNASNNWSNALTVLGFQGCWNEVNLLSNGMTSSTQLQQSLSFGDWESDSYISNRGEGVLRWPTRLFLSSSATDFERFKPSISKHQTQSTPSKTEGQNRGRTAVEGTFWVERRRQGSTRTS